VSPEVAIASRSNGTEATATEPHIHMCPLSYRYIFLFT
jgi:hypothetical protein